ncbi:MAG: hypothetical protein IPN17_26660 [Deltaproteobacteria bacterium]|nr:hypothetical protein [Deltaproteobacteria bacterium]
MSTAIIVRDGEEVVYVGSAEDGNRVVPPDLRFAVTDRAHVVPRLSQLRRPGVERGLDLWERRWSPRATRSRTPLHGGREVPAAELDAA